MRARDTFQGNSLIQVISDLSHWICLRVSPTLESKAAVTQFFKVELASLPEGIFQALQLAVDELVGNAFEHGCGLDPKRCVDISLIRTDAVILFHIRDDGAGFSLETLQHAAVNNPPDKPLQHTELRSKMGLRPGGFGIMLVKQLADELIYNEEGNEVLLIKYLTPGPRLSEPATT